MSNTSPDTQPVAVPRNVWDTIADPNRYRLSPAVTVRDAADNPITVVVDNPDHDHPGGCHPDRQWDIDVAYGAHLANRLGYSVAAARTFARGYATHAAIHRRTN